MAKIINFRGEFLGISSPRDLSPYARLAGIVNSRTPPIFIPITPRCQPGIAEEGLNGALILPSFAEVSKILPLSFQPM